MSVAKPVQENRTRNPYMNGVGLTLFEIQAFVLWLLIVCAFALADGNQEKFNWKHRAEKFIFLLHKFSVCLEVKNG